MRWLAVLLLLAPALAQLLMVNHYGVDFPYYDQWEGVGALFVKMNAGTLGIADFFAQHNEHRILFPLLIFYPLARLTHWNIRAELFVIWGIYVLIAWNLWRMILATGFAISRKSYWLFFAVCVLVFSPLQWQNQLWGFQVGFVLPLLFVIASLRVALGARHPWNFIGTIALGFACTFSIASGFMCWILTLPVLLMPGGTISLRDRKGWWLVWGGAFAASVAFYLHGYVKPPQHPSIWTVFEDPAGAFQYWLTYLGLPFAFGTALDPSGVAQEVGALLVLALGGAAGYLWRWRRDAALIARALPWLMAALVAVISATLTTIGRVGFGPEQALNSRYVTFAIPLPIGLAVLAVLIMGHLAGRDARAAGTARTWLVSLTSMLALLLVLGTLKELDAWPRKHRAMLMDKALVETINLVDEPDLLERYVEVRHVLPLLRSRINLLDQIGYLRPGVLKAGAPLGAVCDPAAPGDARYGQLQDATNLPDHRFSLNGWAVLPEKGWSVPPKKARAADAVLLTYDDAAGKPVLFALADVNQLRTDLPDTADETADPRSGWVKVFSRERLPAAWNAIKAWAFDSETCRAYRLQGSVNLQR